MTAFYNDTDDKVCAWLAELSARDLVTRGTIDRRSITEINGDDLSGYDRVHLFAGIGGWDYAIRLAGWPDDRPVWTGSCPCQPFSSAGKQKGHQDERHLWPEMFRLIRECRPDTVFGEQVASAVGHGWLDGVFADLEGEGYACGAVVLGAHSVGAPHIRQRLYWVADRIGTGLEGRELAGERTDAQRQAAERGGDAGGVEHAEHGRQAIQEQGQESGRAGASGWVGNAPGVGQCGGQADGLGQPAEVLGARCQAGWSAYDLIPCRDGKSRRVESGSFPLAHGVPARVGRLRGYGNAIVPQVAAEFVRAYMEARA